MRKLFCLPCEIQHREFDSKLLLASRIADAGDAVVLVGYDRYFSSILRHIPNCFLLDKSMSTIMLNSRIKPCKENNGVVFINDEEGVNDLEETPEALDIRADNNSVAYIDKYLAWGLDDASFFGSRKKNLASKIIIAGSHRYDLLSSLGKNFYAEDISSIRRIFGDFILYNDNLAVDHYDKNYQPPTSRFKSDTQQQSKATNEWSDLVLNHTSRRILVRDFILSLAKSGLNIVVRPHPVYDPIFWHESFRLIPNIHTIYQHSVEPWIHASRAVITTGCTTGLQALLAHIPSFEMPVGKSSAYSSKVLPVCSNSSSLTHESISQISHHFDLARQQSMNRWHHVGSTTQVMSDMILDSSVTLRPQKSFEFLNKFKSLAPDPPKWRNLSDGQVRDKFKKVVSVIQTDKPLKCMKVANSLYAVFRAN